MSAAMTIGSLFAGIGGLELGLERAGVGHVVWQVEKDAYCRAVLAKHWPDATQYEDVKDVGRRNLAPVDVICGGFPCQDISSAGRGAGLTGKRSGLWFEFERIVRELRPRYVVVENVRALFVRGFDVVLGALADCGYDAEWSVCAAVDVGAPHQRDRVFIVAHASNDLRRAQRRSVGGSEAAREGETPARRVCAGDRSAGNDGSSTSREALADANGSRELQPQGCECDERGWAGDCREDVADFASARRDSRQSSTGRAIRHGTRWPESQRRGRGINGAHWSVEPNVGRVADGVPRRVDRLRALGNAVVPQVAEVVGRVILDLEGQRGAA